MTHIQNLKELFMWCFPAAFLLFFAVTPSLALLGAARYIVSCLETSPKDEATGLKLGFWKKVFLGILGGIVGEITAIAMFYPAESSWCRDMYAQGSYCGGLEPLVLILTVPLCAILGSCASILWTWYSLRIRSNNPWASVFSYCGRNRALNVGFAVAFQAVYLAIFALAVYLLTRDLL
jgi:uncharacterized membrane protein HdeD (DUF308 family)